MDPEIYVTTLISLFVGYPLWAGERAVEKVLDTSKFLPTRADIKPILDENVESTRTTFYWDNRAEHQLEERRQIAAQRRAESPEHRASVVDRDRMEMAKAGMSMRQEGVRVDAALAAAEFKAKWGVSDTQFDAIRNQGDHWRRPVVEPEIERAQADIQQSEAAE